MMLASHLKGTPAMHVAWLELMWELRRGAKYMDAGCGTGDVSQMLLQLRPDLQAVLVNKDAEQLEKCPKELRRLCADFCETGFPDAHFDGILFSWAFGYGPELQEKLEECARLLRPGGRLLLWEPSGTWETRRGLYLFHKFHAYLPEQVIAAASKAFTLRVFAQPACSTQLAEDFAASVGETEIFERVFSRIVPYLLVLEKR